MIEIDGSYGEGGGQLLRSSVSFSMATGMPVKIANIRAGRENPGLRPQHLKAVEAAALMCNGVVKGLEAGSREVEFAPGRIEGGALSVDVGTAGSVTLVLQALLPAALHSNYNFEISVEGGTDVQWSPPVDYMRFVLISLLKRAGFDIEFRLVRRGYYPKGCGLVEVMMRPSRAAGGIKLLECGVVKGIKGVSHAHESLRQRGVAERQGRSARMELLNRLSNKNIGCDIKIEEEYADTLSVGSGVTLWAECGNTIIGAGALGGRSRSAEEVGMEAAKNLISDLNGKWAVDVHMADQIMPYLALFGGEVSVPELSKHAVTNMHVARQFGFELKLEDGILKADVP
jgi:RNA 3'-phosphate cyclase